MAGHPNNKSQQPPVEGPMANVDPRRDAYTNLKAELLRHEVDPSIVQFKEKPVPDESGGPPWVELSAWTQNGLIQLDVAPVRFRGVIGTDPVPAGWEAPELPPAAPHDLAAIRGMSQRQRNQLGIGNVE